MKAAKPGSISAPLDSNEAIAECLQDEQQLKTTIYAACQFVPTKKAGHEEKKDGSSD